MTWLDKRDPVREKKLEFLRGMLRAEIDTMTAEQLALATVIARLARSDDPRLVALIEETAGL